MTLKDIILDQKELLIKGYHDKTLIKRDALDYFGDLLNSKLVKVISGPRRCGKSVLIYLLLKGRDFAYLNFDDERIPGYKADEILSAFYEIYGKDLKNIFFDEIQNLPKWELFINRLQRNGFNIFVTGSNAKLLSKELATHLTGRHIEISLLPFSFSEYLKAIGFNENTNSTMGRSLMRKEMDNYAEKGGFPEVIVEKENPKSYLTQLYRNIIERDIVLRYNINYKKTFREIAMVLISNPGRSITYNKLKNQFSLKSEHTVKDYVSYLQEAYIVFMVNRYSNKPVEIEKSPKKIYVIDTGIVNNVSIRLRSDLGQIYENIVAIELLRRTHQNLGMEVFYWKSPADHEIDFLIKKDLKIKQLLQVCYNIDNPETKKREMKALIAASKELKCDELLVINRDYEKDEDFEWFGTKKRIRFLPLWKWLLE